MSRSGFLVSARTQRGGDELTWQFHATEVEAKASAQGMANALGAVYRDQCLVNVYECRWWDAAEGNDSRNHWVTGDLIYSCWSR